MSDPGDAANPARRKWADLAASAGAGVLGFGLGALLAPRAGWLAVAALIVGAALHALGMIVKGAIERAEVDRLPRWVAPLTWACWGFLGVLLLVLLVRLLG